MTDSGSAPEPSEVEGNRPPEILSLEILPREPTADQTLELEAQVRDPERDALDLEVEWRVNGARYQRSAELSLPASELRRGDEVSAVLYASDADSEVSAEAAPVTIANRPPLMTGLDLLPAQPSGNDNLMAVPHAVDPEGDEIQFAYRWTRNGQPLPEATGATVPAALVRRGDGFSLEVTPSDGSAEGSSVVSRVVKVQNAPPRITSQPSYQVATPTEYAYQIEVEDPDGDAPLRFELLEGPSDMKLDVVSGQLSWTVPAQAHGSYTIEVAVNDPFGGVAKQRYTIAIRWEEPAAAPSEGAPASIGDGSQEPAPEAAPPGEGAAPERP